MTIGLSQDIIHQLYVVNKVGYSIDMMIFERIVFSMQKTSVTGSQVCLKPLAIVMRAHSAPIVSSLPELRYLASSIPALGTE